ncbi:MAG: Rho GTPase protein rac1 [Watsoniomyces obsoletus]|nr:MAG: Rho GTPase protein rac1 [Watsoniomyces obsoletus]
MAKKDKKKSSKHKDVGNDVQPVTTNEEGPSPVSLEPDTVNGGGVALQPDSTSQENSKRVSKEDLKTEKRKKKASKRKREDEAVEAEHVDLPPGAFIDRVGDPSVGESLFKPVQKKAKKSKTEKDEPSNPLVEAGLEQANAELHLTNGKSRDPKKEKSKEKKNKGKRTETATNGVASDATPAAEQNTQESPPEAAEDKEQDPPADSAVNGVSSSSKNHRFIVFVGNLPYTATTAAIATHFTSVQPISIRHSTHKDDPTRSKGFAFLEFDGYDKMKTCLKLYHHSRFPAGGENEGGEGEVKLGRKINVELTAGGGGHSTSRVEKLKQKNTKLNEERKRLAAKEMGIELETNDQEPANTDASPNDEVSGTKSAKKNGKSGKGGIKSNKDQKNNSKKAGPKDGKSRSGRGKIEKSTSQSKGKRENGNGKGKRMGRDQGRGKGVRGGTGGSGGRSGANAVAVGMRNGGSGKAEGGRTKTEIGNGGNAIKKAEKKDTSVQKNAHGKGNGPGDGNANAGEHGNIHPSRMARVSTR